MTKTNGTSPSVFDEITAMLAGIKPTELNRPPDGANPRGSKKSLGVLDDEVKRMFILHRKLSREANPLISEAAGLLDELTGPLARAMSTEGDEIAKVEMLFGFDTPANREKMKRIKEINYIMVTKKPLVDMVKDLFWLEVRRRNPDAACVNSLTICADWHLAEITPAEADPLAGLMAELFGHKRGAGPARKFDS